MTAARARRRVPRWEPRYLGSRVLASDSDLGRLRFALRALLTVVFSAALLHALVDAQHVPASITLLGAFIGMLTSVVVADERRRDQALTLLSVPVIVGLVLALGTLLAPHVVASRVVFGVVTFLAVLVRVFGPRGLALGMLSFMGYFFALFFRAPVEQLPWMLVAVTVAALVCAGVRFGVIRETPGNILEAQARSLRAQVYVVLRLLADVLERGMAHWPAVRTQLARLNEMTLEIERRLDDTPRETRPPFLALPGTRAGVYELELGVEWIAAATRTLVAKEALAAPTAGLLARALEHVSPWAREGMGERVHESLHGAMEAASGAGYATRMQLGSFTSSLGTVLLGLSRLERRVRSVPAVLAPATTPMDPDPEPPPPPARSPFGVELRRALQATLAVGLAMGLGTLVSPVRWAWACIAAFLVFNRATTVGDSVQRAWHRVLGTVVGVLAGIALAHVVSGHPRVELVTLFVCIFIGYYLMRLSYAWMVLFVTAELALLYSLLGRYSPDLLLLRLLETMVGAASGALVAWTIFPTRTRGHTQGLMGGLLEDLAAFLEALAAEHRVPVSRWWALERSRTLDRTLRSVREAAAPFNSLALFGSPEITRRVASAGRLVFYARSLARLVHPAPGPAPWVDEFLRLRIGRVAVRVRRLEALRMETPAPAEPPYADPELLPRPDGSGEGVSVAWEPWVAHQMVHRMNEALVELAQLFGLTPPSLPGDGSPP